MTFWRIDFPDANQPETNMPYAPISDEERHEMMRRDALRAEEARGRVDGVVVHGELDVRQLLAPRSASHGLAGTAHDAGAFPAELPAEQVARLYGLPPRVEDPGETPEAVIARESREQAENSRLRSMLERIKAAEKTKAQR